MTKIVMVTTKGEINLNLFDEEAPMTVASFLFLAKQGYYNGLKFHRVIANFMIQGGCPTGTGYHGPTKKGINSFPFQGKNISYPFADEFQSGRKFDKPGLLAMANAGKNTNGSQENVVFEALTAEDNVEFVGRMHGMNPADLKERTKFLLEKMMGTKDNKEFLNSMNA